jgi:hypothetical protein
VFLGEEFIPRYAAVVHTAQKTVVESDQVAAAVLSMMEGREKWEGSASDLLACSPGTSDHQRDGRVPPTI